MIDHECVKLTVLTQEAILFFISNIASSWWKLQAACALCGSAFVAEKTLGKDFARTCALVGFMACSGCLLLVPSLKFELIDVWIFRLQAVSSCSLHNLRAQHSFSIGH